MSSQRVPSPQTTWRAAGLFEQLGVEGFRLKEIVDIAGELLRLAGERAIEPRYRRTPEA